MVGGSYYFWLGASADAETGSSSLRSPEPLCVSGLPGNDPARVAAHVRKHDPWLVECLLGWTGHAPPQPWGAAMGFALEIAAGYGLIKGESDANSTELGYAVCEILAASA